MGYKHILLVENDINLCQSILLILQRAGYLVTAPSCIHEAMETIQAGGYHMVIADIDEPGTREVVLPFVLHKLPSLPLIILTDLHREDRHVDDPFKNMHFLVKPLAPEELLECVGDLFNINNITSLMDHFGYPLPPR